jgi:exopolyphosphatase/guanosine-5'-triphosphate,3'-diphosphate pyrophosphatase
MWEEMKNEIKDKIKSKKPVVAIGSGGNINKIFSLSKTKDGKPMPVSVIKKYLKEMQNLSVEERMHYYQFREDRADVIVPALQIFNNVMTWAEIKHIYVPKISVADGLVKSIYYNLKKKINEFPKSKQDTLSYIRLIKILIIFIGIPIPFCNS